MDSGPLVGQWQWGEWRCREGQEGSKRPKGIQRVTKGATGGHKRHIVIGGPHGGIWLHMGANGGIGGHIGNIGGRICSPAVEQFSPNNKMLLTFFHLSFLINPEVIHGRMTMLVTLFLVLINIHNTIQTNSPKVGLFSVFALHLVFLRLKVLLL